MRNRRIRRLALAATTLAAVTFSASAHADEVSFSLWQYSEPGLGDWWKTVVAAFEEETGIEVSVRNRPISEYNPQIIVELANSAAADVILVSTSRLTEYAAGGRLMPLDDVVGSGPIQERIPEGAWESMKTNGQIFAVPIAGRTMELLYNACYFEEAGLEGPPTSPEEFLAAARALVQKDESGNVLRYGSNMNNAHEDPAYELLLMWTIAHGGTHFSDEDGNWQLTSQPVVDALTFMKTLYDEGLVPKAVPEADQRAMFATGQSGMTIDGSWQFPFIEQNNAANYDCYRSARHPWDGPATGGPNTAMSVNAEAENPEAALAFIEFASRPEFQKTFADYSPLIPIGIGALTEGQVAARPYITPWMESIGSATRIPPPGHGDQMSQVWPIIVDAMIVSFQDDVPPAEALAEAQAKLEECCAE